MHRSREPWTTEEDLYLQKNYHIMAIQDFSKILGRSKKAIGARAHGLGITRRYKAIPRDTNRIFSVQAKYFFARLQMAYDIAKEANIELDVGKFISVYGQMIKEGRL